MSHELYYRLVSEELVKLNREYKSIHEEKIRYIKHFDREVAKFNSEPHSLDDVIQFIGGSFERILTYLERQSQINKIRCGIGKKLCTTIPHEYSNVLKLLFERY